MSVTFYMPGAPSAGSVQMHAGTGRIVLAMLGEHDDSLEGWMPLSTFAERLQALTPERLAEKAQPARRVDPSHYDHGSPIERLTVHVAGLRKLAAAARARQPEGARIAWG